MQILLLYLTGRKYLLVPFFSLPLNSHMFIRLICLYTFFNCLNIKEEQTLLYGYFKIIKEGTWGNMYNGKFLLKIMVSVKFSLSKLYMGSCLG
jgi:hypothetical protein